MKTEDKEDLAAKLQSSIPGGVSDMARRRLQKKGDLDQLGGMWTLRWRTDRLDKNGKVKRGWSPRVAIGPCEGDMRLTRKEAERIAWDNFLSRQDQNVVTPMAMVTIREFVQRKFIPEHVAMLKKAGQIHYGTRSERTGEYGGMFKHILPMVGEKRLRDVTVSDLQELVSTLRVEKRKKIGKQDVVTKAPASVQTKLHVKNALSAIFEHAIGIEWCNRNPAKPIKLPEMKRKPSHALSYAQADQLLQALRNPARGMSLCSMLTSMNVAEICGLIWKYLNLTDEWIIADDTAIPPMTLLVCQQWRLGEYTSVKETKRERLIPIAGILASEFAAMKKRGVYAGPEDPVFVSRNGTPVDEHNIANRHLRPVGKTLGMPWLSWHCFRRTTATRADQLGAGTSDRKGILGHSTNTMAAHYVEPADHERRRAFLEQIAAAIVPASKGTVVQ